MKRLILLVILGLLTANFSFVYAAEPQYKSAGKVILAPSGSKLTAVDPLVYAVSTDVIPARPFLYTVDQNGITITRFNDNTVVGHWDWPKDIIYTVLPNGSFTGLNPPAEWEPVAMTVSYPTETEFGNRGMTGTTVLKQIPDLTPPWTFVYVVMAHSGYQWNSSDGHFRDAVVPCPSACPNESAMLIQIDVSDPSFSVSRDPVAPGGPHIAGALLGHGAGQPVYDRSTGNVYVGNMPTNSLPTALSSFVSVINRIPPTVTAEEAEVPGLSMPVIRCGPQHPETGIPVGRPQAYACYDPSGVHPINDNEHVGAYGNFVWEFRNLPEWLTAHKDKMTGELDGILYGTPPTTGEWFAEARVHNLDDEYGIFSDWTPIQLLVTPTAEYLPIRAQFAAGVPVAYPLEGTGSCALGGNVPAWVEAVPVPNGCIVMGRAPLDGEYYNFTMSGFSVTGYPGLSLVFSGNVFGEYGFVPLPEGVGLSGLAFHQVSKVADPSTEAAVLSLEYIGVEPLTGQLYHILAPPGRPQPPNERPPETALTLDVVSQLGAPLAAVLAAARPDIAAVLAASPNLRVKFGEVAVEADRDIFVAAAQIFDPTGGDPGVIPIGGGSISDGALIKVRAAGTPSIINLPGVQAYSLSLDSDLRTAIIGVEPGQVDHGALWVSGTTTGNVAVINTDTGGLIGGEALKADEAGPLGSVSVDFGTQYAYVAAESSNSVAIFAPAESTRPLMEPRIWSSEEVTWNRGLAGSFQLMATGDGLPALSLLGDLPAGLTFADVGNGFATLSGTPGPETGGDYAFTLVATGSTGSYAQAFGISVQVPPTITSGDTATFIAGSASSFTIAGTGQPTPIFFTWNETLMPPGVQLVDNEDGTASLRGTPAAEGTYQFTINATTGAPPDAAQLFTLIVNPAGTQRAPVITSTNTVTWEVIGAPFAPDPFTITSIGSPTPTLTVIGTLPPGVTFIDNGNSTGALGGACRIAWPGMAPSCLGILSAAAEGSWTFIIAATNAAGTTEQTFTLVVEPNTTILGAAPSTLSFVTDGTLIPAQDVSLTTLGDVLPYAVVTTANWLSATPISGMTPATLSVSANAAGLVPGTYTGTVIVGSAGTEGPFATVAVTLTVIPMSQPNMVGIWPGMLRFDYNVNQGTTPPPQTIWVMSGGAALNYKVSTNAKWLSAPASGTAPGGFSVSVDPKVGVGMHIGNLTIASASALNGPVTIPVTLVKTAGDSDLIQVMFDVGGGPEGLAIDRNTHNLFITSSNAAAEAGSEAAGENGPEVEAPGPSEPSTVFHINPLGKAVVGEIVVHSEGEYIGVNSRTGRAYHASQGTGEIAVIDGSTNTVLVFIPLTLDGGVYQPYQVAIDEAQNLIYVGAKAPPIPDPITGPPFPAWCMAIHEMPDDEYDCWNPGRVFVIDGNTNQIISSFLAGDDPEGVVFAAKTGKVYASNEDDGSITVAKGAVRNSDGSITPPEVLSTIIKGVPVKGWWKPEFDPKTGYYGERGQAALWPKLSACNGKDDEAEEADKMAVDPDGDVYIIDDRYRVAKINGLSDKVDKVLEIPNYDCELEVPDGSEVLFRNTANNIAYMALGKGRLYVTSEQNTLSLIDPATMTIKATLTIPGAVELDAITTDRALNMVFITDEDKASLWILKGACANGTGTRCVQ